ncbi:MAG: glycosyltransferase family 2 protein [Candidatus Shapirobacteria bacterium]|jgi:hypothetical protein
MLSVNIIVLNWNQPQLTLATLDSLLKITSSGFSYHIYLVDNGSTDNSLSVFAKQFSAHPQITLLSTGKNLGYVGGNNFGILHSDPKAKYFLICNNDIRVSKTFLATLLDSAQNCSHPSIVGPKIYFESGYEYFPDRYQPSDLGKVIWSAGGHIDWANIYGTNIGIDEVDQGQFDQSAYQIDFLSGCCQLIPRTIINTIGLLDDAYFMYLEDADYCQRALRAGFGLDFVPNSVIWHLNAKSSGSGSDLHDYFLTRNRLLFGFKYSKPRTKLALFRQSLITLFGSVSNWQKRGVADYYFHRLNRGSWPL